MNNIHNFTNRSLCEYQTIFPTVAALLDQLLFTIGNGFDVDPETGMIVDGAGVAITEYPEMTAEDWQKLIADCHAKERKSAERYSHITHISPVFEEQFAETCAAYKPFNVNDSDFSEESLYADLRKMVADREKSPERWEDEIMLRPYPLSTKYSDIYNLNENTPQWFIQIAINLSKAWERFLTEELNAGKVWIKPSLRPGKKVNKEVSKATRELINKILAERGDPPRTKEVYKEPESDYADIVWTTKHRDMLRDLIVKLEKITKHECV